jgi:hypothetical protein
LKYYEKLKGSIMATVALSGIITPSNVVTATSTTTLTNKTLTAPTIASANLTTALTLAGAAGTNGQVLTSAGSGLPSWTTIASGLAAASLAEMEAATSNTVAATPLNTNSHPGVAKVWIKCDAAGGILGSHNVTSITDVAAGKVTVTIATDFSSTNYVIVGTSVSGNDDCYVSVDGSGTGGVDPTAGAFRALNKTSAGGNQDPAAYMFACFGDQ